MVLQYSHLSLGVCCSRSTIILLPGRCRLQFQWCTVPLAAISYHKLLVAASRQPTNGQCTLHATGASRLPAPATGRLYRQGLQLCCIAPCCVLVSARCCQAHIQGRPIVSEGAYAFSQKARTSRQRIKFENGYSRYKKTAWHLNVR